MTKKKSNEKKEPKLSLGQALKDCRNVGKLSVESVAKSLNLKSTLIRDLEDNLDQIIENEVYPKIYLRGYLANYAKEIGLSNINSFPQFQQLSSPVKSTAHLRAPDIIPEKRGLPKKVKWAIFTMVLIPVIAMTVFLFSSPTSNDQALVETTPTENATMRIPSRSEPAEHPVQNDQQNESEQGIETQTTTPETTDTTVQVPVTEVPVEVTASEQVMESEPVIEQQVVVTQPDPPEAVKETLILKFKEDCWTEIYDANGDKLALDLYKAGKELTLAGTPPFNLVLGNPFAVDIYYQDELFIKQFKTGRTARFNLPE